MDVPNLIGSSVSLTIHSSPRIFFENRVSISRGFGISSYGLACKMSAVSSNGSVSHTTSFGADVYSGRNVNKRSSFESLFCYDNAIPEEIIDKPIGVPLTAKSIGDNTKCADCDAKGVVLCTTCSGSGLYVDAILESQGIIVKVRCLGCGGSGNIMCSDCGGRGHLGHT